LDRIYDYKKHHTYLLPQAYPEGCPLHPSYPSGHATIAGACVTILKAFFNENFVIPQPVIPKRSLDDDEDDSGTELERYNGPALKVGNELNKLASNIGIGRNMAGVHYRSDYADSLKLGEQIAINILEDQRLMYNENYTFSFTMFDGTPKTIGKP
jgi:PAP2 superfamily